MGKLLLLSWGVYPSTGGSTIIVNSISKGFSKEEIVLAGQIPVNLPEKPWASFSDVRLYYLDPFPFGIRRGAKYLRWLRFHQLLHELLQIVESEGVDKILAIFPDEYYCCLGWRLSRKLDMPFHIWFHNSYLDNRQGLLRSLAKYLQPKFFRDAKTVFVMSEGLKSEMSKNYPGTKFTTLVHGFDIESASKVPSSFNTSKTKFLYSGSLNDSCLDASLRLFRTILTEERNEVHIYSGNPEFFIENGITGSNVIFHEFLPVQDFVNRLREYDIMLLPHGLDGLRSEFEYRTIFPTRTVPLLFSNRPILSHSPEHSFLTDFLIKNDCALVVTVKSEEKIRYAIRELTVNSALRIRLTTNALKAANQFKLGNVVQLIKDKLN